MTVSYSLRFQVIEKRCESLQAEVGEVKQLLLESLQTLDAHKNERMILQNALVLALSLPAKSRLRFAKVLVEWVHRYGLEHPISKQFLEILHWMERAELEELGL